MPVKMIVTDLDRTLLHTDITVSDYTAEVLEFCQKGGIKIVFATARPKNRVDILPHMNLADAVVVNNGSSIYIKNNAIMRFGIPGPIVKSILETLCNYLPELHISAEYSDIVYRNRPKEDGLWEGDVLIGFDDLPSLAAEKIVIHAGCNEYPFIQKMLPDDCYAQLCENRLILIMHKTASKWNAVRHIADYFGISTDYTAAFGDDYNDIEMIKNCGFGIAIANALDIVKAEADEICGSNDNDGLAHWLRERCLLE
jgi:hydroxymethylpyrimidine pyrophosphatase-like HAD family hydrolase